MNKTNPIFGKRLKMARIVNELKQKELAELIEVSCNSLCSYEKGKMPSLDNLIKLSEILQVSMDFLLGLENNNHPTEEKMKIQEKIERENLRHETILSSLNKALQNT